MIYNKIPAVFSGTSRIAVADPVNYQYDVTQILVISGLELPEYYEVDFCNVGDAQTVTMIGTDDGVAIPDSFLATGKKIKAYIVVQGEDDGAVETRYEVTIPVNKRPERTDIQPTPAEQQQIDSLVAALEAAVRTEVVYNTEDGHVIATLSPNKIYHFDGSITELDLSFAEPSEGELPRYTFTVNVGDTVPYLIFEEAAIGLPDWYHGLETNSYYEFDAVARAMGGIRNPVYFWKIWKW